MPAVICIVAALARNRVIGRGGGLPWRLPGDLRRFKSLTLGHPVIMGRKTYDSIRSALGGPLPGRTNVVVTRRADLAAPGCEIAPSIAAALERASLKTGGEHCFVIGGGEIYGLALPLATRLELTEIDADVEGDAYFPPFSREEWCESSRQAAADGALRYSFVTYERR